MSSAPHVKKGFDHFCLGRTRGGGLGGRTVFAVLPGAKEGLRRRSFTARTVPRNYLARNGIK